MIKKKKINIISGCEGAGATFLATTLAFIMGKYNDRVTYLEGSSHQGNHSLTLHELFLDKYIWNRRFVDFFYMKSQGEPLNNRVNLYKNVNWVVQKTTEKSNWTLITPNEVAGEYVLWDNPTSISQEELFEKHMGEADLILCVVDVLPSKVLASIGTIEKLKARYLHKTLWLFNKVADSKDKSYAEKFLKIKADYVIDLQPQEDFYKAQRQCISLSDVTAKPMAYAPALLPKIRATMEELAQEILTLY
jgi:hypothetical protein